MIARLTGELGTSVSIDTRLGLCDLVVDVAGVGYAVRCSAITAAVLKWGAIGTLLIYTKVSDSAIALYGFATVEERRLFEHLVGVKNIGPTTALGMLSGAGDCTALVELLAAGDEKAITKLPNVGKRTAAELVAALQERFKEGPP